MEEVLEEVLYIKPEPEEPVDYPLPELEVVAGPLDIEIPTCNQQVNQYCRLCLRDKGSLFPIMSRVQTIMLPDMIAAVTGICINPRDNLPKKVCIHCVVKLDYAYHIRLEFTESYRVLKNLNSSKLYSLWDSLRDFQNGVLAKTETRSEKLLRQNRNIVRTRLIKKEEELTDMIGEELIETCDVEERKVVQTPEDELEMILDPKESLNEMSQIDCKEEAEHDDPKEMESINSDGWEPEDVDSIAHSRTEKKKDAQVANSDKLRTILNYKVEIKETKLDPKKCYICKTDFANPNDLEVHLPEHAHMVPYDCEECKATRTEAKTIFTVIMLHRHFRMHAGSIKCPECAFRTYTSHGLYGHIKRYHMENTNTVYTCEVCGANVKNIKAFEVHSRMHKAIEEGRYTCSFCAKKFATKTRLERHERIHTNERPYQCRYCSKAFTNETSFQAHERSHTGERGYRCEECGKGFRTRTSLSMHLGMIHKIGGVSSNPFKGVRSGSDNKEKYVLYENPVKCSYEGCDFETNVRSKYYSHKAKHDLRFNCSHCEQRFPTKQRLDLHSYVHTELKSFCCDVCGKSFRYRASFVEHMAGHSNIRPYACTVCGMSFVRDRNLKEHMLKHSDELTYACRHCGKKFRYRADLSKHERTHVAGELVTKEEVVVDFESHGGMDVIVEEYDEDGEMVEYLDD
ncbi:zinc finger protein ZFP2-like [Ochlerotatus camptorhynchus]|uniref:zinc finger protein ZFP2-like n=1 Tax=Ochlerotatus camptorhynchus TaxID=644619 RepID=UPI0031D2F346